ncbi:potassium-transporting ATPase, C subunit [Thermobaculum terrenum ATCC BAA-798]|uniref:Potassium-transporting ATPase KdpC subunit n=1 Tax=Thermobaculum terrenum (strain ATCC BAA-798 / CCMEE 7001 / YNP1) TaxID=525904 RepID=D1CGX1_THET1|nr:K(+)-transporting ATPase subunit C [Thermobaculum terrenum]ACZ42992.1 potassium-transporting ATPase, C subunit [Thermobaculum terrenum ATCC BAA-798]
MSLRSNLASALLLLAALTVLTGLGYPLLLTAVAQLAFPHQAGGSLLMDASGRVRGSELIGQSFTSPRYFHPRPSAAGEGGYDPLASGGSNLAPTNQRWLTLVAQRTAQYRQENALSPGQAVPADAVTASGSGLDPDISLENALLQVPRVARARGVPQARLRNLVLQHARGRQLWILGEPRVNVVELNSALDRLGG